MRLPRILRNFQEEVKVDVKGVIISLTNLGVLLEEPQSDLFLVQELINLSKLLELKAYLLAAFKHTGHQT